MSQFDSTVAGSFDIAQTAALDRRNTVLDPLHVVYGLISNPASQLSKHGKKIRPTLDAALKKLAVADKGTFDPSGLKPSPELGRWITKASARAIQTGRQEIGEGDLLAHLKEFVPAITIDESALSDQESGETEAPSFLINLNVLADQGKLDPVIGRSREIRAAMEILGRRSKNNPVLVGDAGVGKTAVVEGLADLIVKGQVPDALKDKTIYSLDLGALMAGTKFRGEFEERLQKLISFVKGKEGQAILFVDEIHQLVGAGRTDGAMDAANLLKPSLARGELHCIGATTNDEYQKYILSDSALERRFRAVPVLEPSEQDAVEIMMGLKEKFEIHHGIQISDEAIFSSVFLSVQYIQGKNLPDKAIDLIDESASSLKLSAEAMPADLVELEQEIRSKMLFSKTEKAKPELQEEIAELKKKFEEGKQRWDAEVHELRRRSELKNRLDRLRFECDKLQSEGKYEQASQIKYSAMPQVERELAAVESKWMLTREHVAQVIARQTGIPVEKILKSRQESILGLEGYLKSRVYGQENPIHEISETIIAAHAGLTDPTRPLGSFLLCGPSGVGKTETAKAIAHYLFNSDDAMIRIDLSEYSEKHSVAKLIGAPAGYVGYEEGGILTEAVRRRPYAVILFDEIEKAHPDFADILLQVLDDGRLTDNKGRTISFRNTIVAATTNSKNLERDFKPEVLGRFDAMLNYTSLDKSVVGKLVEREVVQLNSRLEQRNLKIHISPELREEVSARGWDERFGARPLKSVFQRLITRPLSHRLLQGDLPKSGSIEARVNDQGSVVFQ